MRLSFLGTGSAFSLERYNGAVAVDGRLLLDGGAPLLPHMHRVGIEPARIEAVFVTHFHGDHLLGLPPFLLYRSLQAGGRLTVVGPPGVEARLEELSRLCWGDDWQPHTERFQLTYEESTGSGRAAGVDYETVNLRHGRSGGMGYRLRVAGRLLAYAGDAEPTPELDELVQAADVAIIEATAPGEVPSHTSWEQAQQLIARHPRTRFLLNHVFSGELDGAVRDLQQIDV